MTVSEKSGSEASIALPAGDLEIRLLEDRDLDEADRIMRIAFGTYLKAPNPSEVFGDGDWVHTRYHADPGAAFCAELDGEVVGSNFSTRWGSFGFFGPLTVRADLWGRGIASRLMEPVMELFERWEVRHAGLFTWPESPSTSGSTTSSASGRSSYLPCSSRKSRRRLAKRPTRHSPPSAETVPRTTSWGAVGK
jgi:GNAT superfamily N-acetyltransferase